MLLENKPESAVDRADLRKALSLAGRHGPLKLLHGVIRLMFSEEELAQSCGKGLRRNKSGREPLDPHKISICEGEFVFTCLMCRLKVLIEIIKTSITLPFRVERPFKYG